MQEAKKTVTITVNSIETSVSHEKISYDSLVELAYPGGSQSGAIYIVKYSAGQSGVDKRLMGHDEKVMVKDGMRFRISPTGES